MSDDHSGDSRKGNYFQPSDTPAGRADIVRTDLAMFQDGMSVREVADELQIRESDALRIKKSWLS